MISGRLLGSAAGVALTTLAVLVACGSKRDGFDESQQPGPDTDGSFLPSEGGFVSDDSGTGLPQGETRDPKTCEEAKTTKSYVGCDYWPTVTANGVWSIFDFTAVVANVSDKDATITVTGPNAVNKTVTVQAGQVAKVYLPWVPQLKGPDANECGSSDGPTASVMAPGGAYHLVSSVPVIVYQFNALQYKGEGGEGADGGTKDWSTCPGSAVKCPGSGLFPIPQFIGCFSFSNDASLLLPSTAMTGNYRIIGQHGLSAKPLFGPEQGVVATQFSVTATEPGTTVSIALSGSATVIASNGAGIAATSGGGTVTFTLANAGDVAQILSAKGKNIDLSGSLVTANKPVQVIASVPCINLPADKAACDHIEETVLPAETLGKRYVVAPPTGPKGTPVKHNVRFYGNRDGTTLTYAPSKPADCPATLDAGQVVDCNLVTDAFEVSGDQEFAVATFLLSAQAVDPTDKRGDPSASSYASLEQFRTKYLFLAPTDYSVAFVDITATENAQIELDGAPLNAPWTKIGNGPFGVHRVPLTAGNDGAHTITSKIAVGIQVVGYGDYTSYQYPGGLNLNIIAPPPVTK